MADPKQYGLKNNQFTTNSQPDSEHVVEVDVAKANVIFDGTSNNIFNTEKGEIDKANGIEVKGSYANAATSVALMWKGINQNKLQNPVYIDGIGTTRYKTDSTAGYGMGQGETGIEVRALLAFQALDDVLIANRGGELPALLNINVYGFSRGSATARHFIHLVNEKTRMHYPKGWVKMRLRINFVGLFDTVSSFGYDGNFDDDVKQLHLTFEAGYAQKVLHLVAGDEYRKNFSVTTIASAGDIGHELVIPGSHSDVGGSYNVVEDELRSLQDPKVRHFVYEQGWYTPQDMSAAYRPRHGGVDTYIHERKAVLGEYSKVGHSIMVDAANAHLGTTVFIALKPPVDPDVLLIQTKLRAFAKDKKNTRWDLNQEMPAKAKEIRRKHFHVSFSDSLGMSPLLGAEGKPVRKFIAG